MGEPPAVESLSETVRNRLERADATLAIAETATGGAVGAALTDRPGASAVLDRVLVPYDYDALRDLLAVDRELLDEHGAVSAPVTVALAKAVRDTADVTWGVANTAIAGPSGGSEAKPVGTAFVAVAYAAPWETGESATTVERYAFEGDRQAIRGAVTAQTLRDLLARCDDSAE